MIAAIADHHVAKFFEGIEVAVDLDRRHHVLAFDLTGRRLKVVGTDRLFHLIGADAVTRHALRVEPQAHRQVLAAKCLDLGHAFNRGEQGLHHTAQVVGHGRRR